jgi:sterol desaturase/sphingolipid hydroxylase (fatty acid hydroxylase superfamily)
MPSWAADEPIWRGAIAFSLLALLLCWEWRRPWRRSGPNHRRRVVSNIGLAVVDAITVRLVLPSSLVAWAAVVGERGAGPIDLAALPVAIGIPLTLLAFDLAIWAQHRLFHRVPVLWRLHRVHHTDHALDALSGFRFHPLEILLSLAIKGGLIWLLGPSPLAVLLFEILLNAGSLFSHANVAMSPRLERVLRLVLVTPALHRVHHSMIPAETDSNFGFLVNWWDRMLGTWRDAPAAGPEGVAIGLAGFAPEHDERLDKLIVRPFLPRASFPAGD